MPEGRRFTGTGQGRRVTGQGRRFTGQGRHAVLLGKVAVSLGKVAVLLGGHRVTGPGGFRVQGLLWPGLALGFRAYSGWL